MCWGRLALNSAGNWHSRSTIGHPYCRHLQIFVSLAKQINVFFYFILFFKPQFCLFPFKHVLTVAVKGDFALYATKEAACNFVLYSLVFYVSSFLELNHQSGQKRLVLSAWTRIKQLTRDSQPLRDALSSFLPFCPLGKQTSRRKIQLPPSREEAILLKVIVSDLPH